MHQETAQYVTGQAALKTRIQVLYATGHGRLEQPRSLGQPRYLEQPTSLGNFGSSELEGIAFYAHGQTTASPRADII